MLKPTKVFPADFPVNSAFRMHNDGIGQYWFYHKGTFPGGDPPLLYNHIISTATSSIEIWEPYFNVSHPNRDQDIFTSIKPNVTIKILTKKGLTRASTYLSDVHNALKFVIPLDLNTRFGLRVINKGDTANYGGWFFHDRFLIIDYKEVYVIGSSIGWHVSSQESTGILKIENAESKVFIQCLYNEYWNHAVSNEIPIQYLHL